MAKLKSLEVDTKQKSIVRSEYTMDSIATTASTINTIHNGMLDIQAISQSLVKKSNKLNQGDLSEIETMLMTQAETLNTLFNKILVNVSDLQMINQIQVLTDIALRAQNQSRKTLLVLADLKNPKRAVFIRNQNNAFNQQINNNTNKSS